ncbi:MAG: putative colanic acid biosynthesis acetyltransferase [Acidobacteria bacterium]|nr:MAG: putative colanic acid biosynthesis acetyltransferase [Acidobacteriota bacterium]
MTNSDPYLQPAFSRRNRLLRFLWGIVYALLFRTSPRPMHAWRNFLLRCFGATIGPNSHIYPTARIWAPWNLICEENATIADDVVVYNPLAVRLGSHAILSQQAYLCGATHDYEDPEFPLISFPITLGPYSWVCARATVQPGVNIGEGAILALASVATRDLEPWTVYGGIPARKIKMRVLREKSEVQPKQS